MTGQYIMLGLCCVYDIESTFKTSCGFPRKSPWRDAITWDPQWPDRLKQTTNYWSLNLKIIAIVYGLAYIVCVLDWELRSCLNLFKGWWWNLSSATAETRTTETLIQHLISAAANIINADFFESTRVKSLIWHESCNICHINCTRPVWAYLFSERLFGWYFQTVSNMFFHFPSLKSGKSQLTKIRLLWVATSTAGRWLWPGR